MPNKNNTKAGGPSRRSPRLSVGGEESKPLIAHPLGTPGTSRHLSDKKRQRSEEEIEAIKRECRNNTVDVRGSAIFYDTLEDLTDKPPAHSSKNIKAIEGACVDSEEDESKSFNPKQTSTESEGSTSDEEDTSPHHTSLPSQILNVSSSMEELAKSMALAFQTAEVQMSIRTALAPQFEK